MCNKVSITLTIKPIIIPKYLRNNIYITNNLITGPPGIIKFENEGIAYSVIQNCSPYAIWIERNDPMGYAEHHTEEAKAEKLDRKFVATLLKEVTVSSVAQRKTHLWTEEAKREHINESANINVFTQFERKYEDLILKHFKIVSIGKNDL